MNVVIINTYSSYSTIRPANIHNMLGPILHKIIFVRVNIINTNLVII